MPVVPVTDYLFGRSRYIPAPLPNSGRPAPSTNASKRSNCFEGRSMAMTVLPRDFREFLKLLNSNGVEYLVGGGYAVSLYGYVRSTNDLDIWVDNSTGNSIRLERAVREIGFDSPELTADLFPTRNNMVRLGVPPIRIEILTSVSGVEFRSCFPGENHGRDRRGVSAVRSVSGAFERTRRRPDGRKISPTWRTCQSRPRAPTATGPPDPIVDS